MSFAESYLGQLRAYVGSRPLISVGARVLIENEDGAFAIIKRSDTGLWGLPGGAMELGESLPDAVRREALEETGFAIQDVTHFGLSSDPNTETHTYPNGDAVQNVSLLAHARIAPDAPKATDGEATDLKFLAHQDIEKSTFVATEWPTFTHWQTFLASGVFQIV